MMRWIIGTSLKFRYLVVAGGIAMMVFGLGVLRDSPVDVFPEFSQPKVEIQTLTFGLSAEETEQLVTVPMEQALQGLPDLETIRSKSVPALSQVVLLFERGTDVLKARQLVAERVGTVTPTLPTWASPPVMIQPLSSTSRVMKIGLTSDSLSLIEMSTIAYWKIRARLLRVPGVANTPIWGERLQQMQVHVDPQKLKEHGVSLLRVMDDTANALDAGLLRFSDGSVIGTGGFIDTPNQRLNVQHVLPIVSPKDLANVAIEKQDGKPLTLADVATLVEDHQPLAGDAVINDGPGLMLIVEKLPVGEHARGHPRGRGGDQGAATRPARDGDRHDHLPAGDVHRGVDRQPDEGAPDRLAPRRPRPRLLPLRVACRRDQPGLDPDVADRCGHRALPARHDDQRDGPGGVRDRSGGGRRRRDHRRREHRPPAPPAPRRGQPTVDRIRRARGIARGAERDRVRDADHRRGDDADLLPHRPDRGVLQAPRRHVRAGSGRVAPRRPDGDPGSVPDAAAERVARPSAVPVVRWLQGGYERVLAPIIRRPRSAYAVVAITMVAGIGAVPMLGQELLPNFKERDFLMHWLTSPDTAGAEETRVSIRACQELRTIPGVRNCGSHIGQAFLSDEPYGIYFGENWISVDPKVDYDRTLASVQEVVSGYPGIRRDVQTYLKERIREVLTGSSDAIVVRINGDNLHVLEEKANEVLEVMEGVDGLVEPKVELHKAIPQIVVKVDLAAAQRYGVKPGDVRRASATWFASEEVGDVFRGGRAYDVHVWSKPEARNSLTSVRELPIDTPSGEIVLLSELADVRIAETPNTIEREHLTRRLEVSANVSGRDLGSVVGDLQERLENVKFPLGYDAEVLGELDEAKAAQKDLLLYGIGAAVVILLLLQASFGNWRLAILSFLTLPMALVGGVLAAHLGGGVLSLGSLVGFLTVFGIAARNGILMINHFQHLERYEGEVFGPGLVLRGARERLSPILMTTLATGLAIVPLVVAGNAPGHEIEHPLAIVVLGGLVTSTLLNLLVVPALYLRFGKGAAAPDLATAGTAR